jgi:hypothetical protein
MVFECRLSVRLHWESVEIASGNVHPVLLVRSYCIWLGALPHWYALIMPLVKPLKDRTDEQIESLSGVYEKWAVGGAVAVIVGIILEVVIVIKNPPYGGPCQQYGSLVADLLVGFGIIAEVWFGKRESLCQSELRRRSNERLAEAVVQASEASERASKAELATEQLKRESAWRTLTQEEHIGLVEALKAGGPPASVRFSVVADDQESLYFAGQISIAFKAAGWRVGYSYESFRNAIFTGILLPQISENHLEEVKAINNRVREAFISATIRFVNGWPESYMNTGGGEPLITPIASVYVGPKPMPAYVS